MRARATIGLLALILLSACGGIERAPTATPTAVATSTTAASRTATPTVIPTAIATVTPTTSAATGTSARATGSASVTASVRVGTPASKNVNTAQIDAAARQWNGTSIRSYTITVQDATFWHVQINTVTVENGSVVSQSATCMNAPAESPPCKVEPFTGADYTVPGLFAWARSSIASPDLTVRITFDPDYGFPRAIGTDIPNVNDTFHSLSVKEFVAVPRMPPPMPSP